MFITLFALLFHCSLIHCLSPPSRMESPSKCLVCSPLALISSVWNSACSIVVTQDMLLEGIRETEKDKRGRTKIK